MSDFLGRLAARSLGVARIAQPIGHGMFAPGLEQTGRSQESFTEAVSSSPGKYPEGRTTAPSITSVHGSTITGNSAHEPQADFSVVDARVTAPYDLKASESNKGTLTSPLRPTIESLGDAERVRTKSKDSAEAQGIVPDTQDANDAHADVAPASHLLVPMANLHREAFPLSSFSAGQSAGRDHHATVSASSPVVKVSIGRVEVRAEFPAPAPRTSSQRSSSLALSLDEYARQRREGKR